MQFPAVLCKGQLSVQREAFLTGGRAPHQRAVREAQNPPVKDLCRLVQLITTECNVNPSANSASQAQGSATKVDRSLPISKINSEIKPSPSGALGGTCSRKGSHPSTHGTSRWFPWILIIAQRFSRSNIHIFHATSFLYTVFCHEPH